MNDLNSSDGEPEWQKVVDAENNYVERLLGGGFRKEGHGCNSCEAAMINGVYSHEHGCPNTGKIKVDGEWVNPDQDDDDDDFTDSEPEYPVMTPDGGGGVRGPHFESDASQVVSRMLEDYDSPGDYAQRPGGPKDWLRQKHHLSKLDTSAGFKGKRFGQTDKDIEDFEKTNEKPEHWQKSWEKEAKEKAPNSRFKWKPPQA